jgi:mRNA interferase YafQ
MKIKFHKDFEKQMLKLRSGEQNKLRERLKIFLKNQFDPQLNNHPLKGKYLNYRSINIGGDLRAVYKRVSDEECFFTEIGTHSELYS